MPLAGKTAKNVSTTEGTGVRGKFNHKPLTGAIHIASEEKTTQYSVPQGLRYFDCASNQNFLFSRKVRARNGVPIADVALLVFSQDIYFVIVDEFSGQIQFSDFVFEG